MDVEMTIINGHLDEGMYMMQSDGFLSKSQEYIICKMQRFSYEFKQASKSWNIRFDKENQNVWFWSKP
jgi:hypothetical protein